MAQSITLSPRERQFLDRQRVGHLATADRQAVPHVVPICFAILDDTLYFSIDEKPKSISRQPLKRLRNIRANPNICVVVDRYDEDWQRLGWVMLWGRAEILAQGSEHDRAQALLRGRYSQYQAMQISSHPVVAIRVQRTANWGNLSAD
jgi:PPOX class probable F420-dependent enzyme